MIEYENLTEEQKRQFVESKLFQKYFAYKSLTDGIRALQEDDAMFDSLVDGVLRRQSAVSSKQTVEDVLEALVAEVDDNTEFVEPSEAFEETAEDHSHEFTTLSDDGERQ